jgi:hypothetical protein
MAEAKTIIQELESYNTSLGTLLLGLFSFAYKAELEN